MTMGGLIVDEPEEDKGGAAMGGGMPGGLGMGM
jgi:hypothetical protein